MDGRMELFLKLLTYFAKRRTSKQLPSVSKHLLLAKVIIMYIKNKLFFFSKEKNFINFYILRFKILKCCFDI